MLEVQILLERHPAQINIGGFPALLRQHPSVSKSLELLFTRALRRGTNK
jgi:hypothetical protein